MELSFEDLGEQAIKNIDRPVRCYRVRSELDGITNASVQQSDTPSPLPDKPSIAVLPFTNLSGDPDQEYFADGMTEDIISGLSRFRSLFVISRNSTFAYKGRSPDVRVVARDLGVRYVLEGSVRRGGKRLRIAAQLVDAETGNHIWADRYDRELEDIFAVQDEVTEAIVAAIAPEIGDVERERAQRKPPDNLDAWAQAFRLILGIAGELKSEVATAGSAKRSLGNMRRTETLWPAFGESEIRDRHRTHRGHASRQTGSTPYGFDRHRDNQRPVDDKG